MIPGRLILRLRSLFLRSKVEKELDEELRYHIERQIEENIAAGMTAGQARSAALRAMGGVEQQKEQCRDSRRVNWIENLFRDIRYSLRVMAREPAFTCAAVLLLGLGIGANTAVFTMVRSVLLRQLPLRNADRLIWIWSTRTDRDKAFFSIPNFLDTAERARSLEGIAAFANWGANLTGSGEAERLNGARITANAFELMGVNPILGRVILPSDGTPSSASVAVITHGLWQRRFGADRGLIGRQILLNGTAFTVVGVLPPDFLLPNSTAEVAVPLIFETDPFRSDRSTNFLRSFALLKPGVVREQADAELASITEQLKAEYPDDNAKFTKPRVLSLRDEVVGNYRAALWTLLGAVAIVLLVVCTNLANMSLARSAARRRDYAIRAAIGGSRAHLLQELITSSLMLATAGGAAGVLLAWAGVQALLAVRPDDLPRVAEVGIDWNVFLFTASISLLSGIVFGVLPAWQTNKVDVNDELRGGGRTDSGNIQAGRMRNILVVAEVALSAVLLVGTGLLIRSFVNLQSVTPGVETTNLLAVRLSLPPAKYSNDDAFVSFLDRLITRVQSRAGVESAGMGSVLPLSGANTRADFTIIGRPPATEAERPAAQYRWVTAGYFRTMGIPVIAGREFTEFDTARSQRVVIVDQALAERHWPGENPIGKHLRVGDSGPEAREVEIVGIVGNVKHFNLDDPPTPAYYSPVPQAPATAITFLLNGMNLVVRTRVQPLSLADPIRRDVQSLDKDVAATAQTMDQILAASVAPRRFNLHLIELFAGAALILAAIGLYSVIAYTVVQRRREIGVRIALGASARQVFQQTLAEALVLTAIGEAAGFAAALLTMGTMSRMLFGVTATDPLTFTTIGLLLAITGLFASWIPARRAAYVDPVIALRSD